MVSDSGIPVIGIQTGEADLDWAMAGEGKYLMSERMGKKVPGEDPAESASGHLSAWARSAICASHIAAREADRSRN